MFPKTTLKMDLSARDRKFTLVVGLLVLMMGLGTLTSSWKVSTYAPLAIMMGVFLVCLVAMVGLKKSF